MDIEFPEFYERKRLTEITNKYNTGLMGYGQRAMTIDEQVQLRVGMAGNAYSTLLGWGIWE